jgi:hypothetical protein
MGQLRSVVVVGIWGLLGGVSCDSRAKASDPAKPVRLSKELESCGTSGHCADDLACLEHVCRSPTRSTVGDYYAALGAMSRARGDLEAAVAAYAAALGHYDAEKVKMPAEIDCAYGGTLAAARGKKAEYAERGAKVLHRCVLAVPVGGALRGQAMLDLASLAESGLDPLALGKNQLADVYLTKGPSKPSSDKVSINISAAPALPNKFGTGFAAKLAESKPGLVACWQAYNDATRKEILAVTIGVRAAYYVSEDYPDDPNSGGFSVKLDTASGLGGPEAAADACVRAIVEPAVKASPRESLNSKVTVTLK